MEAGQVGRHAEYGGITGEDSRGHGFHEGFEEPGSRAATEEFQDARIGARGQSRNERFDQQPHQSLRRKQIVTDGFQYSFRSGNGPPPVPEADAVTCA
jgi:hypothetical protein